MELLVRVRVQMRGRSTCNRSVGKGCMRLNNTFLSLIVLFFFFSSRRRHTRSLRDWSSDVCSSDLGNTGRAGGPAAVGAPPGTGAAGADGGNAPGVAGWRSGGRGAGARRGARIRGQIGRASCRERV